MTSRFGLVLHPLIQRQIRDVKSRRCCICEPQKCHTRSISTRLVLQKKITQSALSKSHRSKSVRSQRTPTQPLVTYNTLSPSFTSFPNSDLRTHPSPPHRLPTIPLPNNILPLTPINAETIRAHLPLHHLCRPSNHSSTRIHQRPHLIRTPFPRNRPSTTNLLIPQRLTQRIRNLPRMRTNTIPPIMAPASTSLRRGAVSSFLRSGHGRRARRDELLVGRQRALGELRRGRGREGLQVVPHFGGVGAGFLADLGLLGGREARHGDVFAAEVGWAGL